jgi:hypothetical protein
MVAAPLVEDNGEQRRTAEQEVSKEIRGVSEYLLEVHRLPPGRKRDGVTRLMNKNLNGLQSMLSKNEKLDKARQVINDLQANVVCYNEHRQNLKHKANRNGFHQMFNGGETELRAIAAHNVNEDAGKFQESGTAMLVFGDLIEQFDPEGSGRDDLGSGQWTFMKYTGGDGVATRVNCGYSPCSNKKKDSGTVYQQHRWHLINKLNALTCPRERFCKDLLRQMKQWRAAGKRLVLCLDADENIYREKLGRQLTDLHGLGMKEVVGEFMVRRLGATFFRVSKPIDAIRATSDLEVAHACVMPVGYGVGDHRLFVVDFSTAFIVGMCPPKIIHPALRRLNTKIPVCALRYNWVLRKNILRHQLLEQMISVAEFNDSKEVVSK